MGKKKDKKLVTHVALILDRSGSMSFVRKEAISEYNKQIKVLQEGTKDNMKTTVTRVTFSTVVDAPHGVEQDVESIKPIPEEEYIPEGYTALYDAIGSTTSKMEGFKDAGDKDTSFLLIVITDGQENNSKEFVGGKLPGLIKRLQATNRWTFTVLGANMDLNNLADTTGIPRMNTMSFDATKAGVQDSGAKMRGATVSYLAGKGMGMTASTDFYKGDEDSE